MRFVSYLRVSTTRQGRSGLGLDAQRETVACYGRAHSLAMLGEHVEVESGRKAERPELERALAACRLHKAILVVAKVDRLTRSVAFLTRLLESGVEVRFCDLPALEGPTGRFMLTQMAAVAELEAGLISARTKAALAAAKARGIRLGGRNPGSLTDRGRQAGRARQVQRARERAQLLEPTLIELRAEGLTTLRQLASALNEREVPTPRGRAWSPAAVARVLSYLET